MKPQSSGQRGASLIEVLVTMVIMAVGLLGLAGLTLANARSSKNSFYRTEATFLAHDILDSIRANKSALNAYVTGINDTPSCSANPGTPDAVAACDLAAWKARLAGAPGLDQNYDGTADCSGGSCTPGLYGLPDGAGSISVNGQVVTVRIEWNDRRNIAVNPADPCSETDTRPACFQTMGGV
ncbi:MAG: type pilus modification protein PilV [Pseudomonadota bacterium]|jgi:type IV pilus assembly protein PilV